MIVCSVHDPAVFDAALFEDSDHYEGWMALHLDNVRVAHLLACDDSPEGSAIWSEILRAQASSPLLAAKLGACLNPQRVVYVNPHPTRPQKVRPRLDSDGSAQAVGLIANPGVDVLIAAQGTVEAMEAEGISANKVFTASSYHNSEAYRRERLSFGGRALRDLTKADFLDQIIRPVVCWAREATIVDKVITRAAFGDAGNGDPKPTWPKFKQTVAAIHAAWKEGAYASEGTFRVISSHTSYMIGDALAEELAKKLDLGCKDLHVVLKRPQDVHDLGHDRYLVTDKDMCVGFTKGFDLLADDKACGATDAYLRQPQAERDTVVELIHAQSQGEWRGSA